MKFINFFIFSSRSVIMKSRFVQVSVRTSHRFKLRTSTARSTRADRSCDSHWAV